MVTGVKGANMTANAIGTQVTIKDATSKSDRRSNKPIMEKRRRARINNCLNELKTLILDATKKDPARHSKLEKADILEKTVKHLQELQRQQAALTQAVDPKVINKFKAGFTDCANEVSRFPGLEPNVKRRLLQHLSICINGVKTELHQHQRNAAAQQSQKLHAHMLPSPPSSPEQDQQMHNIVGSAAGTVPPTFASTTSVPAAATQIQATPNGFFLPNGLQVIPTKLPNGSIALVLPQSLPQQNTQPPMLVPIPSRTASTSSASSHVSSSYERTLSSPLSSTSASMHYAPPSPANSYETMDSHRSVIHHASAITAAQQFHQHQQQQQQQQQQHHQQHHHHHHHNQHLQQMQQPLSLVVKKDMREQEDQPWRPW